MTSRASCSGPRNNKKDDEFLDIKNHSHKNTPSCFSDVFIKISLLFVIVAFISFVHNQFVIPTQQFFNRSSYTFLAPKDDLSMHSTSSDVDTTRQNKISQFHQFKSETTPFKADNKSSDQIKLESILKKASMKDKYNNTVILTALNAAWAGKNSIFDLFLESFRVGYQTGTLLKHLVVVALDQRAYSRCMEVHSLCYGLTTEGVDFSGEAHYMTEDYLKMVWKKIDFLRSVLELGYNFVFTDADIVWLRDPFQRFYPDGDIQIACDQYRYNSTNLYNPPNAGFKFVKANNRTIKLYKFWYQGKDYFPGNKTQDVFNVIKFGPFFREIGLQMRFLETRYFGGFCEPSKDLDLVITMHANCCYGMKNKTHDIKMLIDDWKRYTALPVGERNLSTRSWTIPRLCGRP